MSSIPELYLPIFGLLHLAPFYHVGKVFPMRSAMILFFGLAYSVAFAVEHCTKSTADILGLETLGSLAKVMDLVVLGSLPIFFFFAYQRATNKRAIFGCIATFFAVLGVGGAIGAIPVVAEDVEKQIAANAETSYNHAHMFLQVAFASTLIATSTLSEPTSAEAEKHPASTAAAEPSKVKKP